EWNPSEVEGLHDSLDRIFDRLQCLPTSVSPENNGYIWKAHAGRVDFVTNSNFYRVEEIGGMDMGGFQVGNNGPMRPQTSLAVLEQRLCAEYGERKPERRGRKERTQRQKKKRVPPD